MKGNLFLLLPIFVPVAMALVQYYVRLTAKGRNVLTVLTLAATAAMAGQTVRVLVEAAGRNEGTVNGRLDNNLVVEFKAPETLIGQWANVHITGSRAALLVGELAE